MTFLEPTTRAAVAEPPITKRPSPAAPGPTSIQAKSAPTAWEHPSQDEVLDEKESDLGGTSVPVAAPATLERLRAFHALLASLPEAPAVPLAAMDRENLYP